MSKPYVNVESCICVCFCNVNVYLNHVIDFVRYLYLDLFCRFRVQLLKK